MTTPSEQARGGRAGWPDINNSPLSSASTSVSSSFSSSTGFRMPADSSQSDLNSSDHSAAAAPKWTLAHDHVAPPLPPRSSSFAVAMGQSYSKASPPNSPTSVSGGSTSNSTSKGISFANAAVAGSKLKRAFGARRKNRSQDSSQILASRSENGRQANSPPIQSAGASTSFYSPKSNPTTPTQVTALSPRSRGVKLTLQLATQVLGGGKRSARTPTQPPSPTPPPPPPKPASMQSAKVPPPIAVRGGEYRASIIPISPGISSAVNFMRLGEQMRDQERAAQEKGKQVEKIPSDTTGDSKESWRKSDSTISHVTIRPGATVGNRTSRPVSMAESLQSTHTIVPVNKRLSALITDADFVMAEEDDDTSFTSVKEDLPMVSAKPSPPSSVRSKNRRSMSLNLGPTQSKVAVPASLSSTGVVMATAFKQPTKSLPDSPPLSPPLPARETPTLTRTAANGFISPSSSGLQSTGNNIRGRLAAWTATSNTNSSRQDQPPPKLPPRPPRHTPSPGPPPSHGPSLRQTAISMSTGFAPAAGLAKRAVEKMGRAWGGLSSGSTASGYSSSSSSGPSSYSDHQLARTSSNQSGSGHNFLPVGKGKPRRTPDAPSGAWSVSSSIGSTSLSDSEAFTTPSGPSLGERVRGPLRGSGNVVFGKDLRTVVRETMVGVGVGAHGYRNGPRKSLERQDNEVDLTALEGRLLPALVMRCAEHLLIWGVQEEGLFRVSGRPSHVTKIRTEFDTGADYDMKDCSPGELDPHSVASVFKAFLRELPEPILTHDLIPYFEAALSQETNTNAQEAVNLPRIGGRGPGLPSGPKGGGLPALRKPPSLSTLAMPTFSGMRPPSKSFINALKSLISQLPFENRDLIRTVTELIKATAKEQKTTKMPLSNLLLVFCPSLNMSPPLLRVLCEAEDIWEGPPLESPVIDIKRQTLGVLDISPISPTRNETKSVVEVDEEDGDLDSEEFSDAEDMPEEAISEVNKADIPFPAVEPPSPPQNGGHDNNKSTVSRPRPVGPRRAAVPAVVFRDVDAVGVDVTQVSTGDTLQASTPYASAAAATSSESTSLRDDVSSCLSTSEGCSITSQSSRAEALSPPPLSSSAESLATPSSSSAEPSLLHIPIEKDQFTKSEPSRSPVIADVTELSLPSTPRKLHISGPIQFPTTSGSAPSSPLSPRRSMTLLSLQNLQGNSELQPGMTNSAPSSPLRRMKKPSLHLLFTKRSASPLTSSHSSSGNPFISSPYMQTPKAASESSVSTPISAVTAPQYSTYTLDTPIESSPLRLGLGLDMENTSPRRDDDIDVETASVTVEDAEDDTSASYFPGETPIADRYRSGPNSTLSLAGTTSTPPVSHLRLRPTLRTRSSSKASFLSTASSNHLGLLDDEDEEDWTKSVLMAADFNITDVQGSIPSSSR